MRFFGTLSAAATLAILLLVAPSPTLAEQAPIAAELDAMQARLQQMERELAASSARLEAAGERIEEQGHLLEIAGTEPGRGASSGLGCLVCDWTIGGWVSASYFWNIGDPQDNEAGDFVDGGGVGYLNQGINGVFYPYHPDHNSFALDQLWFEVEKEISEENRAGFATSIGYGKTAAMIGGPSNRDSVRDDTAIYILEAYVQYMAPLGDGLTFKMGKFGTTIGNEYAQTIYNWNITHGSVFNLLEPLDHIGILASYEFGETGFDAAIGGVNGFFPDDPDINDQKSILWHLGWANDTFSAGVNGIYGSEERGFDGDQTGVVNLVLTFDPSERLGFWINSDFNWADDGDAMAWGVAAAGRFGFTDQTAIALRGEYVTDIDRFLGMCGFGSEFVDPSSSQSCDSDAVSNFVITGVDIYGVTATLSHLLTDHLMIRGEVRWDHISKDNTDNGEFFSDDFDANDEDLGLEDDQIVVGIEAVYNFNAFGGE